MELSELMALRTPGATGAIGTIFIQECNAALATYCIDLDNDLPACTDVFDLTDQFHLEFLPLDDDWYLYRVHSYRKYAMVTFPQDEPNLVEICNMPVVQHQLGIDPDTHRIFQQALSLQPYWLLIIRSQLNILLLIEHSSGIVQTIIEKPLEVIEFSLIQ